MSVCSVVEHGDKKIALVRLLRCGGVERVWLWWGGGGGGGGVGGGGGRVEVWWWRQGGGCVECSGVHLVGRHAS